MAEGQGSRTGRAVRFLVKNKNSGLPEVAKEKNVPPFAYTKPAKSRPPEIVLVL